MHCWAPPDLCILPTVAVAQILVSFQVQFRVLAITFKALHGVGPGYLRNHPWGCLAVPPGCIGQACSRSLKCCLLTRLSKCVFSAAVSAPWNTFPSGPETLQTFSLLEFWRKLAFPPKHWETLKLSPWIIYCILIYWKALVEAQGSSFTFFFFWEGDYCCEHTKVVAMKMDGHIQQYPINYSIYYKWNSDRAF